MNRLTLLIACVLVSAILSAKDATTIGQECLQPILIGIKSLTQKQNVTSSQIDDLKKTCESLSGSFTSITSEISSVNNVVKSARDVLNDINEKMSSERSNPPKSDAWGCVSIVIVSLFNIALLSCLGIVLFTLSKMQKNERMESDEIKKLVNLGNQKTVKKLEELSEKGIDNKSISSISNGVDARLKPQFDAVRKMLLSDPQKDVTEKLRSIEKFIQTESVRLREQEKKLVEERTDLKLKTSEAERKKQEADARIANCDRDKASAIEQAKSEVRAFCESESRSVKDQLNAAQSSLATVRVENAQAESVGYQRGIKEFYERNAILERENERLTIKIADAEKNLNDANVNFTEKLKTAIAEKDANMRAALAERQVLIQKEMDEKYATKISQLENSCQEKDSMVLQLSNEKARQLEEHKQLRENSEQQIQGVTAKLNVVTQELETKTAALATAQNTIEDLQSNIYPAAFLGDADFATLKEHLEGWLMAKIPAAEIIKASLGLFAQRDFVNADTWQLALRNISLGVSSCMRSQNESPTAIYVELGSWRNFLMKFSDEKFDFSLQMPKIGDEPNTEWVTSKNKNLLKISAVLSWAVWNNQYGVRHNAEVE